MPGSYFTLAEARALVPYVQRDLEKLQETKREFERLYLELRMRKEQLAYGQASGAEEGGDPFFEMECRLEFLQLEAKSSIRQFFEKGIQIKDIDIGLVDFPALLNGEEVLLCWKMGEPTIEYYHSAEAGFAGRRKIEGEGE
ncbi:cell division protein DivIVA [Gordoniibacillus kamchatkensis]|uniref:Cell division protein DivIVA n=1 Tax=Gordoniibacillus kamchatkensis TaxID=1590651 RepID=A0ABR5ADR3_9BACL|nr:DUF2203 domain-containing protein [Paenibacillus sp. VKM B-2647]KIL39180.1 cell division protein DivIVA [Paenibacillus sp. VKM B-2647]